jgi:hypothetical protein
VTLTGTAMRTMLAVLVGMAWLLTGLWAHAQVGQIAIAVQSGPPSGFSVTYAQSAANSSCCTNGQTTILSLSSTAVPGPYCLVVLASSSTNSVTDSNGDTFTKQQTGGDYAWQLWTAVDAMTSPSSVFVTDIPSQNSAYGIATEYGRCAAIDGSNTASGNATSLSSGNVTAAHAGDMIWGGFTDNYNGATYTQGMGFAGLLSATSASNVSFCGYGTSGCGNYDLTEGMATSPGAVSASATLSQSTNYDGFIVVLAPGTLAACAAGNECAQLAMGNR